MDQLAYNIAEGGGGCFYASLEMPVPLLTPRLTSCRLWMPGTAVVSYQNLIRGLVNDIEMRWVESAAKEMKSWPLVIDDAPGLSAPELALRYREGLSTQLELSDARVLHGADAAHFLAAIRHLEVRVHAAIDPH